MEYDTRMEERVWQRLRSEKTEQNPLQRPDPLPAWIMEQLELSASYLQLSRLLQGKDGAEFVKLARESRAQAVCLKGILTLVTGHGAQIVAPPAHFSAVDAMLRSCYGKELRLMKEYESRSGDPEYGPVYERLSKRGRDHCYALLEMLGKIGKSK